MTRPAQLDFLAELTRAVAKEITREVVAPPQTPTRAMVSVPSRPGRTPAYDFSEPDPRTTPGRFEDVPEWLRIEGFDPE